MHNSISISRQRKWGIHSTAVFAYVGWAGRRFGLKSICISSISCSSQRLSICPYLESLLWVLIDCSISAFWVLSECSLTVLTDCLKIWARMMKIDCSRQTCPWQTDTRQTLALLELLSGQKGQQNEKRKLFEYLHSNKKKLDVLLVSLWNIYLGIEKCLVIKKFKFMTTTHLIN